MASGALQQAKGIQEDGKYVLYVSGAGKIERARLTMGLGAADGRFSLALEFGTETVCRVSAEAWGLAGGGVTLLPATRR